MDTPLYLVSLYYRTSIATGANKRFNATAQRLFALRDGNVYLIVSAGHRPEWCPEDRCIHVPGYKGVVGRLIAWLRLSLILARLPQGIVISDFIPPPLGLKWRHKHIQLQHHVRDASRAALIRWSRISGLVEAWVLNRAHRLLTVSDTSKQELHAAYAIDPDKIIVSYNGIDQLASSFQQHRATDLLYVANYEGRKNHLGLIQGLLAQEIACKLVFVGNDLGMLDQVKAAAKDATAKVKGLEIEFRSNLTEEALDACYQDAKVFVFPSFLEGFGMPLIEAMNAGCRVACSDLAVFREICGDEVRYFDPANPAEIAAAIQEELPVWQAPFQPFLIHDFLWDSISEKLNNDLNKL